MDVERELNQGRELEEKERKFKRLNRRFEECRVNETNKRQYRMES